MSEQPNPNPEPTPSPEPERTFTQADVDQIVRDRVKREREKFADYDEIKAKADGAKTLEDRVAEIERQAKESESRALRAEVANAKGLTPTQAKRLVGQSREELEADADELLKDIGAQKRQGNHVPREGKNPKAGGSDELGEFTKNLFSRAAAD